MFMGKWLARAILGLMVLGAVGLAAADTYSARQYYGGWYKHGTRPYYYRHYYYRPSPTYYGYKHHYAIYYPERPRYIYYYNPYKKHYWGRCPSDAQGKGEYSLLAVEDRKGSIDEIAEEKFPPMAKLPLLPEATDNAQLELPPDDLPPAAAAGLPVK